jgi:lipoprotein-releasing system ATP-binding protein
MTDVHGSVLLLEAVKKGFGSGDTRLEILRGVSLNIRSGELVALVGPSGSGKTTLLQIAGLLALPDTGKVVIASKDVSMAGDNERTLMRRHHVGFVYQFHHLLPELTALENVMMPLLLAGVSQKEAAPKAQILLEQVGLGHRVTHRPAELSGGECQRVAIARAIVAKPDVVLADEPTGNLDPHTSEIVFDVLRTALKASGSGALIATHNPLLAAQMDRVVTLQDGMLT